MLLKREIALNPVYFFILTIIFTLSLLLPEYTYGKSVNTEGLSNDELYILGVNLFGEGNEKEAFKVYTLVAQQGHMGAQYELAEFYRFGFGVKKNLSEAMKWYLKAAEQGHIKAIHEVASAYFEGYGLPESLEDAVKWYKIGGEMGDSFCLFMLGELYTQLPTFGYERAEGIKWFKKAAEQNDATAQFRLGTFYYGGYNSLEKDEEEGIKWLELAAANGSIEAKRALSEIPQAQNSATLEEGIASFELLVGLFKAIYGSPVSVPPIDTKDLINLSAGAMSYIDDNTLRQYANTKDCYVFSSELQSLCLGHPMRVPEDYSTFFYQRYSSCYGLSVSDVGYDVLDSCLQMFNQKENPDPSERQKGDWLMYILHGVLPL